MKSVSAALLLLASTIVVSTEAATAVLFGGSGAVGSEVLASLLDESFYDEVILIGRRPSTKVDQIVSDKKSSDTNVTAITLTDLSDISSYDRVEKTDACFVAIGVADAYDATLAYLHSVEVDLVASVTKFCDKIGARSITVLSAVDMEYESAAPYSQDELTAAGDAPLGWMKMIYHYNRVMGLKEKAAVANAHNIPHVRLFQPNTIITQESRYGWIERMIYAVHHLLDSYPPTRYHSVDVRLLGMAMVADGKEVLQSSILQKAGETNVAKLTYADYLRVAGKSYGEQYGQSSDEL